RPEWVRSRSECSPTNPVVALELLPRRGVVARVEVRGEMLRVGHPLDVVEVARRGLDERRLAGRRVRSAGLHVQTLVGRGHDPVVGEEDRGNLEQRPRVRQVETVLEVVLEQYLSG